MAVLEVCCYSMACAREAERCGADRIELCAAPQEGGLTPSYGVLVSAREAITLPVHPIVRPRGGDFCYTEEEFAAMLNDIRMVRDLGFPGLVTGVLDADGQVDIPRMKKIMGRGGAAGGDLSSRVRSVRRPASGLEKRWVSWGSKRILTSGQQSSAEKGISLITELIAAGDTPIIMAGAGVRAANLPLFLQAGVKEVHSSAGHWLPSEMRFRHPGVSMSADPDADEYRRYAVNGAAVAEMKRIISAWRS
ncbi:Cytoplasmic copper homeostasis protein CutC [Klebsiella pneumoniae IS39]|nr:Cytoplasmic copper homeostasis protein CutC [Klebsiella pneumoniae IS39]